MTTSAWIMLSSFVFTIALWAAIIWGLVEFYGVRDSKRSTLSEAQK